MLHQTKDFGIKTSTTDSHQGFKKAQQRYKHKLLFLGAHTKTGTEEGNGFGTLGE